MIWILSGLLACNTQTKTASSDQTPAEASPSAVGEVQPSTAPARLIQPGAVNGPPAAQPSLQADQCAATADGGPVGADGCTTAVLHCGDTIQGHTRGGIQRLNTKFYEHNYCTPATTNHDGGDERLYLLDLPDPGMRAIVTLDTPCANLDLAAFPAKGGQCPNGDVSVERCEMTIKSGTKREKVDLFNNDAAKWWIVVEGQDEEEGAFGLTVQCEKWQR